MSTTQDHLSTTFEHTFANGKTVSVPKFKKVMTFGRARKLRALSEAEQMFTIFEDICDEKTLAVLDEMDADETSEFFEAWQADSGVTTGESTASTS
jgi:hypothetical protein